MEQHGTCIGDGSPTTKLPALPSAEGGPAASASDATWGEKVEICIARTSVAQGVMPFGFDALQSWDPCEPIFAVPPRIAFRSRTFTRPPLPLEDCQGAVLEDDLLRECPSCGRVHLVAQATKLCTICRLNPMAVAMRHGAGTGQAIQRIRQRHVPRAGNQSIGKLASATDSNRVY